VAAYAAVIIVCAGHGEGVGSHADSRSFSCDGGEREGFWVVKALAGYGADVAVYIVEPAFIDPSDSFTNGDGQVSRVEVKVACENCMVGAIAVLCQSQRGLKSEGQDEEEG